MRKKLTSFLLLLSLLIVLLPAAASGQERIGSLIKRDKNGYKVGDTRISFFDGPGIVNYEYRHRWMPGPAGAALVIGTGAGGGALVGGVTKGKKGAAWGAAIGGGAATALWLYKNRTEKRAIF